MSQVIQPIQASDYDEEEVSLEPEDKKRVLKGMFLLIIFSSVVISSMIFYNAPNYNPNLVFEGTHGYDIRMDKHLYDNPIYKLMSRYIKSNYMELDISLERIGKENVIDSPPIKDLRMFIIFSKNRVRIKIFDKAEYSFEIPSDLLNKEDMNMSKDGKVESLYDSNIGIHIFNHPFGFQLYRKDSNEILFDTTHSVDNADFNTYLYFAKNYIQISTALPEGHYTYGLGENFGSLRLKTGDYYFYANDPFNGDKPTDEQMNKNINAYSSYPNFFTVNPTSMNAYGCVMFNSSPIQVVLQGKYLTYKMTSGLIDLYVFDGPRLKDIIYQEQKTFGMPILPKYTDLNWQANIISSQPEIDIQSINEQIPQESSIKKFPFNAFWIDSQVYTEAIPKVTGYTMNVYQPSPLSISSSFYPLATEHNVCIKTDIEKEVLIGSTKYGDSCVIDYYAQHALELRKSIYEKYNTKMDQKESQVTLMLNEPFITVKTTSNEDNKIKLPFNPFGVRLEENTVPLDIIQYNNNSYTMLNMHNLYSLKEAQIYHNFLLDNNDRPMIFSRGSFIGTQQYAGKWLGYIDATWGGLTYAIRLTMLMNLFGNPNVIHEGCGYNAFNPNAEAKLKEIELKKEVCLRWLQFSAINPFARINNFEILPLLKGEYIKSVEKSFQLRSRLALYLYSYRIKNAGEGGGFILPIFAYCIDTKSEINKKNLFEMESQFMLGANMIVSPIIEPNARKKSTYFPDEVFYDFYTGMIANPEGEITKDVNAPLDTIPIFARGGFITPLQTPSSTYQKVEELRQLPIQLLVALDRNKQAQGKVFIDDGISKDSVMKEIYYRVDFAVVPLIESKELELIFKVTNNKYTLPEGVYPCFDTIIFYGIDKAPTRVHIDKDNAPPFEIGYQYIIYDHSTKVLKIQLKEMEMKLSSLNVYRLILKDV